MPSLIPVWVKIVGMGAESVTFIDCDPSTTNIAKLKKLVKVELSPDLDHIAANRLVVMGTAGEVVEEDTLISVRGEGRSKAGAFIIEAPQTGSHSIY